MIFSDFLASRSLDITIGSLKINLGAEWKGDQDYELSCSLEAARLASNVEELLEVLGGLQLINAIEKFLPEPTRQLLQVIEIDEEGIHLGSLAKMSFEQVYFACRKEGDQQYNYLLEFEGEIRLAGFVKLYGWLQLNLGNVNKPPVEFITKPGGGALGDLEFLCPFPGRQFELAPVLQRLSFYSEEEGTRLTGIGNMGFRGGPDFLAAAMETIDLIIFDVSEQSIRMAVPKWSLNKSFKLPALPMLGMPDFDPGELIVHLDNLTFEMGTKSRVFVDAKFGLPDKLNKLPGMLGLLIDEPIFVTYDPTRPDETMVKTRMSINENGLTAQLKSSPLTMISTFIRNDKLWWIIDMNDWGEVHLMTPTFSIKPGSHVMKASGAFEIIRPLSLSLSSAKQLFGSWLPQFIMDGFPENLEFRDVELLDEGGNLSGKAFGTSLGAWPDGISEGLELLNSRKDAWPHRLQKYLTIKPPKRLYYDFSMDNSGGMEGMFEVGPDDPPLRTIFPGIGIGPALYGVELRKLAIGKIPSAKISTIEIDGTMDQFNLLEIGASMAFSDQQGAMLPSPVDLFATLELRDILAVMPFVGGTPVPIFYDRLYLGRLGAEGLEVHSEFKLPKPTPTTLELARFVLQMADFVHDKDALLSPGQAPDGLEVDWTIGANYLRFPEYMGGGLIGEDKLIEKISTWFYIAHAVNFLKTNRSDEWVKAVSVKHRHGNHNIDFFKISDISLDWLLTTYDEFTEKSYVYLDLKADQVEGVFEKLPKKGRYRKGVFLLMKGEFKLAQTMDVASMFVFGFDENGVFMGFHWQATLAGFLKATCAGEIGFQGTSDWDFSLSGSLNLSVEEEQIMSGQIRLKENEICISGVIDFFPGNDLVDATSEISGTVSTGGMSLNGDTTLNFKGITVVDGEVNIIPEIVTISGSLLGAEVTFSLNKDKVSGSPSMSYDYRFNSGNVYNGGVKVFDDQRLKISVKLSSEIEVSKSKFTWEIQVRFRTLRKSFLIKLTLTTMPRDLNALKSVIGEKILGAVVAHIKDLYKEPEKLAQVLEDQAYSFAEEGIEYTFNTLKNAGKFNTSQLAGTLKNGYRQSASRISGVFRNAGYGVGHTFNALKNQGFSDTTLKTSLWNYPNEDVTKALYGHFSAQTVSGLLKARGCSATTSISYLKSAGIRSVDGLGNALSAYPNSQIAGALDHLFSRKSVANFFKKKNYSATTTISYLKSSGISGVNTLGDALSDYSNKDIAKALDKYYSNKSVANYFKDAGRSASSTISILRDAGISGKTTLGDALSGFTNKDVAKALDKYYTKKSVADYFKSKGYKATSTIKILRDAGISGKNTLGNALGSYSNKYVAKALYKYYSGSSVADYFKDKGKSASTVKGYLEYAGVRNVEKELKSVFEGSSKFFKSLFG